MSKCFLWFRNFPRTPQSIAPIHPWLILSHPGLLLSINSHCPHWSLTRSHPPGPWSSATQLIVPSNPDRYSITLVFFCWLICIIPPDHSLDPTHAVTGLLLPFLVFCWKTSYSGFEFSLHTPIDRSHPTHHQLSLTLVFLCQTSPSGFEFYLYSPINRNSQSPWYFSFKLLLSNPDQFRISR